MQQLPRVFISYARDDGEDFAEDLVQRIEGAGIPVWRDREGMRGGEGWWNQIERVIDEVAFMVVVMTPGAVASDVVRKEWDEARRQGVCIFPVIASDRARFIFSAATSSASSLPKAECAARSRLSLAMMRVPPQHSRRR